MRRTLAFLAALAICIASIVGCGKKGSPFAPASTVHPYFPLAIGNWWEYKATVEILGEQVRGYVGYVRTEVTGTTNIGGKIYFVVVTTSTEQSEQVTAYYCSTDQGIFSYSTDLSTEFLSLPSSLKVGSSWTVGPVTETVDTRSFSCSETWWVISRESVTIPAGTFNNCYKIGREMIMDGEKIGESYLWLAPGVGQVRVEGNIGIFGIVVREELVRYSLRL